MPLPRPAVDVRHPAETFDEFVAWLESVSYRLVLLEEYSLDEVRAAVVTSQRVLTDHMRRPVPEPSDEPESRELYRILGSDHTWFLGSIEQLGWFWSIVAADDQGGHRQALGQYGRILAEAVQRHRRDERLYLDARDRRNAA
jgi:hypothetical protein